MAKKKLKKLLKRALPLAALAAGATMLNRRRQNNTYLAEEGGDRSNMFTKPNMLDIAGGIPDRNRGTILPRPKMMTPQDMANDQMFLDAMAAKGGRIVKTEKGGKAVRRKKKIGIQIKGFGKARRG